MPLSYRTTGYGPPLLLLHGMGVTYSIWENLEPLLRPYYKLILVELPGHGDSSLPPERFSFFTSSMLMLETLRCELGIEQWSILAYSMGTRVLQEYLRCHPQRISSAVYLCPLRVSQPTAWLLALFRWIDPAFPWIGASLLRGRILAWLVVLLGFQGKSHPYADVWTKEISSQPIRTLKKLLIDLPYCGKEAFEIPAAPTLFVWGEQDRIVAQPRRFGAQDRSVPGGHAAPMLAAEQIARLIVGCDAAHLEQPGAQDQDI